MHFPATSEGSFCMIAYWIWLCSFRKEKDTRACIFFRHPQTKALISPNPDAVSINSVANKISKKEKYPRKSWKKNQSRLQKKELDGKSKPKEKTLLDHPPHKSDLPTLRGVLMACQYGCCRLWRRKHIGGRIVWMCKIIFEAFRIWSVYISGSCDIRRNIGGGGWIRWRQTCQKNGQNRNILLGIWNVVFDGRRKM